MLIPEESEIIKQAGSSINFTCTGSRKIFFFYPTNYGSDEVLSEQVFLSLVSYYFCLNTVKIHPLIFCNFGESFCIKSSTYVQ